MILTSKINRNKFYWSLLLCISFLPFFVTAQSAVSLSISPTLFEISANPNQEWSSSLRVINANPFEIRIFADVVNFVPQGEGGQGSFMPVLATDLPGQTMAEWITVGESEIIIPPEQSVQVPFSIMVPEDASPGGHFAAILIGTKSQKNEVGQPNVETSQVISSLLFLRVAGDIVESGSIREFVTNKLVYESPDVTFDLRFENKGNVHLQPQGDIKILNMWGQERGIIPVNRQSMFGNVLPESIRKYRFSWTGEWSLSEIGRYTAIATLAYGEEERQFTTSENHFWIIPWKVLGSIALVLIGFITLFVWAIKIYIRKMLTLAGVSPELQAVKVHKARRRKVSVIAPIEAGILDLRSRMQESTTTKERISSVLSFILSYKFFFFVVIAILTFFVLLVLYIQSASVSQRAYEIKIDGAAGQIQFTSEDVRYEELVNSENFDQMQVVDMKEFPALQLVNQSGISGLAAELKFELEVNGYPVQNIDNEMNVSEEKTVIVYSPEFAQEALELSRFIGETLLSSYVGETESEFPITIYIGSDQADIVE